MKRYFVLLLLNCFLTRNTSGSCYDNLSQSTLTSSSSSSPSSTGSSSTASSTLTTTLPSTATKIAPLSKFSINIIFGNKSIQFSDCANRYPNNCPRDCGCPRYTIDSAWIKAHDSKYYDNTHLSHEWSLSDLSWNGCYPTRIPCTNETLGRYDWSYYYNGTTIEWIPNHQAIIDELVCNTTTKQWSNVKDGVEVGNFYTCSDAQLNLDETTTTKQL